LGEVSTIAGRVSQPGSADGKRGAARFNQPSGISVDKMGNLFVSDYYNHTLRKINPSGEVSTIAGKRTSYGGFDYQISEF
jgi:streptogramin lyase